MADIRLPQITPGTPEAQIGQIQSYLFQLVQQLNYAMVEVDRNVQESQEAMTKAVSGIHVNLPTPKATFQSIKDLIIKSADIIDAYEDSLTERFEGSYVAVSDFGRFEQATSQTIQTNSKDITQIFQNIQGITTNIADIGTAIEGDIDGLRQAIVNVTAYIRTGLLTEAEGTAEPIYGVEIGQNTEIDGVQTYRRFTRLTADRLSFFDANGTEVAYVSNNKLFINQADIDSLEANTAKVKNSLQIGGYLLKAGADGHLTLS